MKLVVAILLAACGRLDFGAHGSDGGTLDAVAMTSCTNLAPTCGATASGNCCDYSTVTGGSYYRSYDVAADMDYSSMFAPATVADFALDTYEVTVGRFRAFVASGNGTLAHPPAAGAGTHPGLPTSGWDPSWTAALLADTPTLEATINCDPTFATWTEAPGANETRPMNCIDWYEATAFCAWDGGYLPTEAEWNYAAAGGDEQRAYPWSSPPGSLTIDGTYTSFFDGTNCVGDGQPGCALTDLTEVGSKPLGNGLWGQSDMAGNVWEWTLDWYASYAAPCSDCADLSPSTNRVFRGGGFYNVAGRTGYRNSTGPLYRYYDIGLRCARAP